MFRKNDQLFCSLPGHCPFGDHIGRWLMRSLTAFGAHFGHLWPLLLMTHLQRPCSVLCLCFAWFPFWFSSGLDPFLLSPAVVE